MPFWRSVPCLLLLFGTSGAAFGQTDAFENRIRPVLAARCYGCHGAGTAAAQGGLRLDSVAGIRKGGNSGPVLVAGAPESSLLLRALRHTDSKLKMPPGKPLPGEVIADFEAWIKSGASMPADRVEAATTASRASLWSLKAPVRASGRQSIDDFVVARLREKGLALSPEADRRTLIRRVTYDLTGLPPSAEEVAAFVGDSRADAYERLVDRLLASPQYGERWGRHWLDVARYADSVNDSVNAGQRFAWSYTYRDWVIRSLNEDLPYDQFLLYQLAADKVPGADRKHLAALGYLSLGRDFPNSYPETVDDRIDAVARGMLGLTVACARCHDHKYDPIPTKDYYSFYSIFSNVREPEELPVLGGGVRGAGEAGESTAVRGGAGGLDARQLAYRAGLAKIRKEEQDYREKRHREMLAFFQSQEAEYVKAARDSAGLSNTEIEDLVRDRQLNLFILRRWMAKLPVDVPVDDFVSVATEGDLNNLRGFKVRYNAMLAKSAYDGAEPRAMSVEDVPKPVPAHVFLRGNPNNPGALTPARFLSCLGGSEDKPFTDGSGRLGLARSIIDPQNPLTARVMVNRVWMHHFGSGLVRTPSDFGFRGEAPTHPELLDHLAVLFRDDFGWSVKKLHRAILLSAAYRQSSGDNPEARKVDPENLLLWRMNRRRLEIEAVRDSALMAAGRLDLKLGGVPVPMNAEPSIPRRTVYGFIERGRLPGFLNAFDFASPDQHAPLRFVTTVPQQALFYLNSAFVVEQARLIAARTKTIPEMYRAVFGRDPSKWEIEAGEKFLASQKEEAEEDKPAAWQYGTLETASQKFVPFELYLGDRWQGSATLPAPVHGRAVLRANGGEPGESEAVVRRWVSPVAGKLTIEGKLRYGPQGKPYAAGLRGRVVSSRNGELAAYNVNGSTADTGVTGITVEKGDTIDFIVTGRKDFEEDGFNWAPVIRVGDAVWNAADDFAGPAARPLDARSRYAQVLLQTNEFAFVD